MTLVRPDAQQAPAATPAPTSPIPRLPAVRCLVALVIAIAVTAVASAPAIRFEGWQWGALGALTAIVWLCAWPVHRDAVVRRAPTALLGSLGTVLPWLWSLDAVLSSGDHTRLRSAAIAAALVVVVDVVHRAAPGEPEGIPARLGVAVPGVAAVSGGLWWPAGSDQAVSVASAVLIVGAPAAPALALSLARLAVARRSRAIGCVIGSGDVLRAAAAVDVVVLDKDQSVTTGDLTVVGVEPVDPDHDRNIRWFAGALEHESDHPIGRAIARLSRPATPTNVRHLPGRGITGSVDRHPVRVGDPAWLGIMATAAVGTPIGVEVDGRPLGHLAVWDDVRPEAVRSLRSLVSMGLDVKVLSADDEAGSRHLAELLGIPAVYADCGPDERSELVARLKRDGRTVAYVGQAGRLNDAALATATVGISTSGSGIVTEDLNVGRLPGIVGLCRAFVDRSRLGRRVTLVGTIVGGVLAAAGQLPPFGACLVASGLCALATLACGNLSGPDTRA